MDVVQQYSLLHDFHTLSGNLVPCIFIKLYLLLEDFKGMNWYFWNTDIIFTLNPKSWQCHPLSPNTSNFHRIGTPLPLHYWYVNHSSLPATQLGTDCSGTQKNVDLKVIVLVERHTGWVVFELTSNNRMWGLPAAAR